VLAWQPVPRDCSPSSVPSAPALSRLAAYRPAEAASDRLPDGHDVAGVRRDAAKDAFRLRFDFDDRLVGLDLHEGLALGDAIPFFLKPGHQLSSFLGHLERGHHDANCHSKVKS
jgi:hypothetical protein